VKGKDTHPEEAKWPALDMDGMEDGEMEPVEILEQWGGQGCSKNGQTFSTGGKLSG
jgi:hypothetical protein